MNIYRILADVSHNCAILLLLFKLLRTRSAAGVSGKTQILYAIVFCTRYADLVDPRYQDLIYSYVGTFKILYIAFTFFFLFLIYHMFRNTYEKKYDTFRIEFLIVPSLIGGILYLDGEPDFTELLWANSILLEAVAILPQMLLIYNTKKIEKYMLLYLIFLGSYRMLYIFNWILRYYSMEHYYLPLQYRAGLIQEVIYLSFFIHYFCYMKVKPRNDFYTSNITEFSPSPANQKLLEVNPESEVPSVFVIGSAKDYSIPEIGHLQKEAQKA